MAEIIAGQSVDESAVLAELSRRAPGWLDQPEPGSAEVLRVEHRTQSVLIRADIAAGSARAPVMVKIPLPSPVRSTPGFRLFDPVADPLEKSRFEYATLVAVDEAVTGRDDDRFGRARAYGHLPESGAIVVGVVEGHTLDRVLRRGRRPAELDEHQLEAVHRAGALLSVVHSASTGHMVERDNTVEDVVADVTDLLGHLRTHGRARRLGERLRTLATEVRRSELWPDRCVMGHGDFAPRNIFVDDDVRVTTVDSLGRFRIPPHEDMAYLLVELATGSTRYSRPGLPWPADWDGRLRRSLLAGYPMDDDPVLWFFEVRALLDKWRSLVDRSEVKRSRRAAARDRARELLVVREVARVVRRFDPKRR